MHAHTYYNRVLWWHKGPFSPHLARNEWNQFSSRRPGLSDSTGGLTMSPLLTAVLQRGELNRAPTCMRLCSGPRGRKGSLFTARSLLM